MKDRILLFDIEVSPLLSENWGYYEQNALRVQRATHLICFAYKWLGDRKIRAYSHLNCAGRTPLDDRKRVKKLWQLFNRADIVVAHNGHDFDVKMVYAYFAHYGMRPPRPFKLVDTKTVAKRHFRFYSNKLSELAEYLGLGHKIHTDYSLWEGCMVGARPSIRKMVEYNKMDVELLEKVYLKLRPFMDIHPNFNVIHNRAVQCPNCGGKTLNKRGFHITRTSRAQRYQCQACGAWSHGRIQRTDAELR